MTAVVDASVLVAALIDTGPHGRWAEEELERGQPLSAPHLVLVEASNILRRSALAGEISDAEASIAHTQLAEFDIELFPFAPLAARVWELRTNLTAYDAWYVALAESLQSPLLSLDRRLSRAPGLRCAVRTPP